MTLQMYGWFEMGLYELATSGSRLFFFSIGRTKACFSGVGKTPLCSERLHSLQMTGAMCGVRRFKSYVEIGSSEQDLAGIVLMRWVISSTVAGWNWLRGGACRGSMTGGFADAVEVRILATLLQKKLAKSAADSSHVSWCSGRWSMVLTVCQRARGFRTLSTIDSQNAENLTYLGPVPSSRVKLTRRLTFDLTLC